MHFVPNKISFRNKDQAAKMPAGDGGYAALKGKGRKRRKISREERLENARLRATRKLGKEAWIIILLTLAKTENKRQYHLIL